MEIAVFLLIPLVGLLSAAHERRLDRVNRRVAQVEHKVDLILEQLGVPVTDPAEPQVVELLRAGRRVRAVKVYRQLTGAGLKDAVAAVDRIAEHLNPDV